MNIIELMQTVGIETFVVAFDEIRDAMNGDTSQYGALGTILGDIDMAKAVVELFGRR